MMASSDKKIVRFPHSPTGDCLDAYPNVCWWTQGDLVLQFRDDDQPLPAHPNGYDSALVAEINVGASLKWILDGAQYGDGTHHISQNDVLRWQQMAANLRSYADLIENCMKRAIEPDDIET